MIRPISSCWRARSSASCGPRAASDLGLIPLPHHQPPALLFIEDRPADFVCSALGTRPSHRSHLLTRGMRPFAMDGGAAVWGRPSALGFNTPCSWSYRAPGAKESVTHHARPRRTVPSCRCRHDRTPKPDSVRPDIATLAGAVATSFIRACAAVCASGQIR